MEVDIVDGGQPGEVQEEGAYLAGINGVKPCVQIPSQRPVFAETEHLRSRRRRGG